MLLSAFGAVFGMLFPDRGIYKAGETIRLRVKPEVSSLDFNNGITLNGFRIPALLTRRAETDVELRDGNPLWPGWIRLRGIDGDAARKEIVGIVDTNCDPEEVDYVIPGNDDAIRAVQLYLNAAADTVLEARAQDIVVQAEQDGFVEAE